VTVTDHDHPIDPERVAHARRRLPSADDAARLTGLLSLMADPVRLRLIYALDIVEELWGVSRILDRASVVSHAAVAAVR